MNDVLPGADTIIDYRIMFNIDGVFFVKHHLPIIPKIGEYLRIPIQRNYTMEGKKILIKVQNILFEWNDGGDSWLLDITVYATEMRTIVS